MARNGVHVYGLDLLTEPLPAHYGFSDKWSAALGGPEHLSALLGVPLPRRGSEDYRRKLFEALNAYDLNKAVPRHNNFYSYVPRADQVRMSLPCSEALRISQLPDPEKTAARRKVVARFGRSQKRYNTLFRKWGELPPLEQLVKLKSEDAFFNMGTTTQKSADKWDRVTRRVFGRQVLNFEPLVSSDDEREMALQINRLVFSHTIGRTYTTSCSDCDDTLDEVRRFGVESRLAARCPKYTRKELAKPLQKRITLSNWEGKTHRPSDVLRLLDHTGHESIPIPFLLLHVLRSRGSQFRAVRAQLQRVAEQLQRADAKTAHSMRPRLEIRMGEAQQKLGLIGPSISGLNLYDGKFLSGALGRKRTPSALGLATYAWRRSKANLLRVVLMRYRDQLAHVLDHIGEKSGVQFNV